MSGQTPDPDPKALAIARAAQNAVHNSAIILYGSRATGTHRENSDVDILLVFNAGPIAEISRAGRAIKQFMAENPPQLRVDIASMDAGRFQYCRRAPNHVAGQAARKGIIMAPERLDFTGNYNDDYDNDYPASWPDIKERLRAAYRHIGGFEREFHHPEGEQENYGFSAQGLSRSPQLLSHPRPRRNRR